jgi:hypothetical protein
MTRAFLWSIAVTILAAGCSSQQHAASRPDRAGAVPASSSEWPGYYDPNYPYYYALPETRMREARPSVAPQPQPPGAPRTPVPQGF